MTKKQASLQVLSTARAIHDTLEGDEGADIWVVMLLSIARGLNPDIENHRVYQRIVDSDGESRQVKLRRLIEHPATQAPEREAAVKALQRIRDAL